MNLATTSSICSEEDSNRMAKKQEFDQFRQYLNIIRNSRRAKEWQDGSDLRTYAVLVGFLKLSNISIGNYWGECLLGLEISDFVSLNARVM